MLPSRNKAVSRLILAAALPAANAFWRMSCSVIQTGRVDPIVSPGSVAGHAHKVSGASNFYFNNTYQDLQASRCTSCEIQDDKSIYWTPMLYYQHPNGSFQEVPNGGTVVYYLGRGDNRTNIEPFPPGFKMLSGDSSLRSNDTTAMTYNTGSVRGRLKSDRVSFACLDSSGPMAEQNYMFRTDCDNGLRAQIQFQSCWDGRDYQPDNSHVTYMSQIDNGVCPPTHPRQLIHLFFEVLYGVNDIQKSPGGRFVFANGDTTGFGFHGDFMNGWDQTVLKDAIQQCVNNDGLNGVISQCAPLAKSQTPYFGTNCPERPPLVNEPVHDMLAQLPGCNNVTSGPARAPQGICATKPSISGPPTDSETGGMWNPTVGDKLSASSSWVYAGCAAELTNKRTLASDSVSSNTGMTIDYCTAACKGKGYALAGLEYARECWCANALSNGASYMNASSCDSMAKMACTGNSTQWCGAPSFLNIWKDTSSGASTTIITKSVASYTSTNTFTTSTKPASSSQTTSPTSSTKPSLSTTSTPSATPLPSSITYAGCYSEPFNGRLLSATSYANSTVTINQCAAFCQAGNYAYIGLEYAGECYCGNGPIASSPTADTKTCNMPCRGNSAQMCGGPSHLSVYSNSNYISVRNVATVKVNGQPAYSYQACYKEGTSGRALGNGASMSGNTVSVETCAVFCKGKGYSWMGVEYGQECYCNNSGPINGAVTAASEGGCNMVCKGDNTEWCGGSSRINVYKATS